MEARATSNTARQFAHRPVQLVIVRANGPLFYSVAGAALLESNVALCAGRMLHFFAGDRELCAWIRGEWWPRKAARAEALRQYVQTTWPEFDWAAASDQYRDLSEADGGLGPKRPTAAHEALARCTGAAQSALFYRSLARWADDARLREMARTMAQEEAASLPRFRAAFERRARVHRLGFIGAWRTALACVRTARDVHLPLAFNALLVQWGPNAPFPEIGYDEFVVRMRSVIERRGDVGTPERLLFRGWTRRPRVRIEQAAVPAPAWFKPLFRAAA